jgi:hypothetical protein
MKYLTLCLVSLIYLCPPISVLADTKIYHWVDEQGKSHFSDTAAPGTKEVHVSLQNLLPNNSAEKQKIADEPAIINDEQQKTVIEYHASITSPIDDQPLRSNEGTIDIHVAITPDKKNKQTLQLFLDGKALGKAQLSPTISAQNINRGTHQVEVHLLDEKGKLLTKTQIVTVHFA